MRKEQREGERSDWRFEGVDGVGGLSWACCDDGDGGLGKAIGLVEEMHLETKSG